MVALGLTGEEVYDIGTVTSGQESVEVSATRPDGSVVTFSTDIRIDTPNEFLYYENGGILHYVLRNLSAS